MAVEGKLAVIVMSCLDHPFAIKVDIMEMAMSQENTTLARVDNQFIRIFWVIVVITGLPPHLPFPKRDHQGQTLSHHNAE